MERIAEWEAKGWQGRGCSWIREFEEGKVRAIR
jgi:hypothetical protein